MRLFFLPALLLALGISGCSPKFRSPGPPVTPGMYKGTEADLKRLWEDILEAAQKDDRDRTRGFLASFIMTPEELASLFGDEQAQAILPRYKAILNGMSNVGAIELCAKVYEDKYDDVLVTRSDGRPAAEMPESDRNIAQALARAKGGARPFYTVRLKRKTEVSGLRYDFFVYINDRWRSGSLLGKYLPAVPSPTVADPAPAAAVEKTVSTP